MLKIAGRILMTHEELQSAYSGVIEQRDALAVILAEIIDTIRSGCLNNWDIDKEGRTRGCADGSAARKNLTFEMGPSKSIEQWIANLENWRMYHLARVVAELLNACPKLDSYTPAEIASALRDFCPEKIIARIKERRERVSIPDEYTPEKCTAILYAIANAKNTSKVSAEDNAIYSEYESLALAGLFKSFGVDIRDSKAVAEFLNKNIEKDSK